MPAKRILIIDDEADIREVAALAAWRKLLAAAGLEGHRRNPDCTFLFSELHR